MKMRFVIRIRRKVNSRVTIGFLGDERRLQCVHQAAVSKLEQIKLFHEHGKSHCCVPVAAFENKSSTLTAKSMSV